MPESEVGALDDRRDPTVVPAGEAAEKVVEALLEQPFGTLKSFYDLPRSS